MNAYAPAIEPTDSDLQRFIDKVDAPDNLADPLPCWPWTGARQSKGRGYGKFWLAGKAMNAHKAAYLMFRGDVGADMVLGHKCNNDNCVNPWHLEVQTQSDNMQYCVASGRHASQQH